MTEEKVHGGVELGIDPDDGDHAQVPPHSDCVDSWKQQEQGQLEVGVFGEAHKDEGDPRCVVFLITMEKREKLTHEGQN